MTNNFNPIYTREPDYGVAGYGKFHQCEVPPVRHIRGPAIDECTEDAHGFLFISNGEYGSQVNFCPMCGYQAKRKIDNDIS